MTTPISSAEAARVLLARRQARATLEGYVRLKYPAWAIPDFHIDFLDTLTRFFTRTLFGPDGQPIHNLMVNAPPRHSKSTFATVLGPVWYQGHDPRRHVMTSSYNNDQAKTFGRDAKMAISDPVHRQAFPDHRISNDVAAANEFYTTEMGKYFGVGLGGTTTGRPANLLCIDDPVKTREEAESATMRRKVIGFYEDSLVLRREPEVDGAKPLQLVCLTRWHPADLGGYIQTLPEWKEGLWHHVSFQGIQSTKTQIQVPRSSLPVDDPRYLTSEQMRRIGKAQRYVYEEKETALWEERFSLEELRRIRERNPRGFASLYQQQPYIEGGAIFKDTAWKFYKPSDRPDDFVFLGIFADTAFKERQSNDYSVAMVWALTHSGDIYALDHIRGRWDYPNLKTRLIRLNTLWRQRGLRGLYIEDKASGQSLIQDLRRESGIAVLPYTLPARFSKTERAHLQADIVNGGRVYLPDDADWVDSYVLEHAQFPSSDHDDQVDVTTMALDVISKIPVHLADTPLLAVNLNASLNSQLRRAGAPGSAGRSDPFSSSANQSLAAALRSGRIRPLGSL